MKGNFIFPFIFILFLTTSIASARQLTIDYNNPLTRSTADNLYCQFNGICSLEALIVGNLTVTNLINMTVTSYDVTGNIDASGNINAHSYSINDTPIQNFFWDVSGDTGLTGSYYGTYDMDLGTGTVTASDYYGLWYGINYTTYPTKTNMVDNITNANTSMKDYTDKTFVKNGTDASLTGLNVIGTGFFSWLGSLTSRITKLFVVDIDASGIINNTDGIMYTNKTCYTPDCSSRIYYNGSGMVIEG